MWNDPRVNFLMVKNAAVWGLIDKENVSIQKHKILWTHNDTKEKNYQHLTGHAGGCLGSHPKNWQREVVAHCGSFPHVDWVTN